MVTSHNFSNNLEDIFNLQENSVKSLQKIPIIYINQFMLLLLLVYFITLIHDRPYSSKILLSHIFICTHTLYFSYKIKQNLKKEIRRKLLTHAKHN